MQCKWYTYTRCWAAEQETFQPTSDHRRRVINGHGSPRFDEDVWRCLRPCVQRSFDFGPAWAELDDLMDYIHMEYAEIKK